MTRATVDTDEGGTTARASGGVPGGTPRLPRILGPQRRPPGLAGGDDTPPVAFVDGGFAEPPRPEEGPAHATFTDYSPPESLFYTHEVEAELDHPPAPTPHAALGVEPDADWSEIKKAYRALVAQLHPDRHVTASAEEQREAADRLAEVNVAYHALAKERKR